MVITSLPKEPRKANIFITLSVFCFLSVLSHAREGLSYTGRIVETPCNVLFEPDLLPESSNAQIEVEIDSILNKYKDEFLGTEAPSASDLANAISKYNDLNIVVSEGLISGVTVKNDYKLVNFLRTFTRHLKYHPKDTSVRRMADNTVWLVTDQICKGLISTSGASSLYSFDNFARSAALISRSFNDTIRALFSYAMNEYGAFEHFWEPEYDFAYQAVHESINTDIMHNLGDALLAFSANQPTEDERFLWMRGFKRWVERFASYSSGTANGIKPDGTGFHHWTAYDGYMFAFKSASKVIYYLSNTSFQIKKENYLIFRDAVYSQIIFGNDQRFKPLSMSGRKPFARDSQYSESTLKMLALAGGHILGLSTADTILAGEYNRLFGVSPDLGYSSIATISGSSGYFQFNYANMGIFRKDGWLVGMKGFTNGLWGAELYPETNRYGRYQSYGTLEVIYPGNDIIGNGYNVSTWNWNYNPGATTIVLPWTKLHGEWARIDESQDRSFCGAIAFKNKNSKVLSKTHGAVGGFAMDFQEKEGVGFSTKYGPNSHNSTFTWKKSTWAFDDIIVALGSNINNDDTSNPTVTTLFQRLDNKDDDLWVNGSNHNETPGFSGTENNWIISNYSTGFYLVAGNDEPFVWNGEQQTPNHDQTDPSAYINNPKGNYWIGYIDHGVNPVDAEYEYIVVPATSMEYMTNLDDRINSSQKPYTVFQKNNDAHILRHNSGIWGYAVFNATVDYTFPGIVQQVSQPCMIMFEPNESNSELRLAIVNPDLGVESRSYEPVMDKHIEITLKGEFIAADTDAVKIEYIDINNGYTNLSFISQKGHSIEVNLIGEVLNYTGVNEKILQERNIIVYPNPAEDEISVEGDFPSHSNWKLINYMGSCVKEGVFTSDKSTINVSDLPRGIYFVNVIYNSDLLFTGKITLK
jgi:hypothetical protein